MPHRSYASTANYRFGFNGKENDNEPKGLGNEQDYGMRIYDPRLGKFLSEDPLRKEYPELTPYQFASNTPLAASDLDGLEKSIQTIKWYYSDNGPLVNSITSDIYVQPEGTWAAVKKETTKETVAKMFIEANNLPANGTFNFVEFESNPELNFATYIFKDENGKVNDIQFSGHYVEEMYKRLNVAHVDAAKVSNVASSLLNLFAAGTLVKAELKGLSADLKVVDPINPSSEIPKSNKGVNNQNTKAATDLGNTIHYDNLNGGKGNGLPSELSQRYPNTQFRFTKRGAKGADVEYVGGKHPSQYPGSNWDPGKDFGDFKPNSSSGKQRFNREIKSGKLPANTQILNYDTKTGKLQ